MGMQDKPSSLPMFEGCDDSLPCKMTNSHSSGIRHNLSPTYNTLEHICGIHPTQFLS